MSADLLAAFGADEPADQGSGIAAEVAPKSPVDHNPWILQSRPSPKVATNASEQNLWKQDRSGTNVLFDASDVEEDEDDFGDFEEVPKDADAEAILVSEPVINDNIDLLGIDDDIASTQISQVQRASTGFSQQRLHDDDRLETEWPKSHTTVDNIVDAWDQLVTISTSTHQQQQQQQQQQQESRSETAVGVAIADDDWDDFEEPKAEAKVKPTPPAQQYRQPKTVETEQKQIPQPLNEDEEDEWDTFEDTSTQQSPPPSAQPTTSASILLTNPRPTNIPPPSHLLQLLPQIFTTLTNQSRQPTPPLTLANQIQKTYSTTARLISGRNHRWKRDTLLSQSTRISQAGVRSTGMKLTALDKSSTVKEDQEAQEAVSSWQRNAAVLNAVLLKQKVQKPPMSLSATMAVRVASGLGVLSAKECCALCGLKRNERVVGIDVNVEDSFGEFWVEFWGHRACYEFWYEYEGLLNKR